jgi:hypothetical protein
MAAIYRAAASILKASPRRAVILDGRTFQRVKQVDDLLDKAATELPRRPLLSPRHDGAEGANRPRAQARFLAPRTRPMPDASKFTVACANLRNQRQRPSSNTARSDRRNAFEPNHACLALGSLPGRLASGLCNDK